VTDPTCERPQHASDERRRVTLEIDAGLWAWLSETGDPHQALVKVLDRARRARILARAWADERAVEVWIRQRQRHLRQRLASTAAAVSAAKLRLLAEDQVLRACEENDDPAVQAAAERVRLRLMISRREVEDEARAKAELRRLRAEHPAGAAPRTPEG
jgi:hypothetical protein